MEADQVAQFIAAECEACSEAQLESAFLYQEYKNWALLEGISRTLKHNSFSQRMKRLGFELVKGTRGKRMIAGIKMKSAYK